MVLPQPELADDTHDLALVDVEADAAHRPHRRNPLAEPVAFGAEDDAQIAQFEKRRPIGHDAQAFGRFVQHAVDEPARRVAAEGRLAQGAGRPREAAARREAAAGLGAQRRRHRTRNAGERLRPVRVTGQERPRVGVARVGDDRPGASALDRLPGIDHAEIVAELGDDAEVVSHEQHREIELGNEVAQQIEDLLLRRHVECRCRLVGDDQRGPAGQRRGYQQALPLTARKLVRIAFERKFRIGHLDAAQQFKHVRTMRPPSVAALRIGRVPAHDLQKLSSDLEDRVQRQIGILRDKPDLPTANPRVDRPLVEFEEVHAGEADFARLDPRARRQEPDDRPYDRRFAAAQLADDAQDASPFEREVDMVEDLGDTLVGADRQPQPFDFEDRVGHHRDRRSRGSKRSRRPSPKRLKPSTVIRIARPGKVEYHQASGR